MPGMAPKSSGVRVKELRKLLTVDHCVLAHMGDINKHTESIHFLDESLPCLAHAPPERGTGDGLTGRIRYQRCIGVPVMAVVGQGGIPGTK